MQKKESVSKSQMSQAYSILDWIVSVIRCRLYVIALISESLLVVFLEFPIGSFPMGGDALPVFNPLQLFRYSMAWNPWVDLGSDIPQLLAGPPVTDAFVLTIPQIMGLGPWGAVWFYAVSFSIIGSVAFAYLFRVVFKGFGKNQIAATIAGSVFLINPSLVTDTFKSIWVGLPERALFPLFVGLFIDGYERRNVKYSIAAGLVTLPLLARFPNDTARYFIAVVASIAIYLSMVHLLSKSRPRVAFTSKYLLTTVITGLMINAYLIYPALLDSSLLGATLSSYSPKLYLNRWSSLFNVVRLVSSWGFYNGYVPYSALYTSNAALIIATIGIPCLAFSVLLINRSKRLLSVAIAGVLLIFAAKGDNEPFGSLFAFIISKSIFKVFYQSSYLIPFLVVVYSLLLGALYGCFNFVAETKVKLNSVKIVSKICVLSLILLTVTVSSWPIITGDVSTNYFAPTMRGVTIPSEYYQMSSWLSNNENGYKTMLAYEPSVYLSTSWGYQGASQYYHVFLDSNLVTGLGTQYTTNFESALSLAYSPDNFASLAPSNKLAIDISASNWKTFQGDNYTMGVGPDGNSSLNWSVPGDSSSHQLAYLLAGANDWSSYDAMSVWVRGNSTLTRLILGVGDQNGFVGWFEAARHVVRERGDWSQLLLPLRTSDISTYALDSVSSIWMSILPGTDASIGFSAPTLGLRSYDSLGWARFLAVIGVKYVVLDQSLEQGKWSYSSILDDKRAFEAKFREGYLTVYENQMMPGTLYSVTSLTYVPNLLGMVDLVRNDSFNPRTEAFTFEPYSRPPKMLGHVYIQTTQVSPDTYYVQINSDSPFLLILDQKFDDRWSISGSLPSNVSHIQVNGFANGWDFSSGGTFAVKLSYGPQDLYSGFLTVSIVSIVAALCLIVKPVFARFRRLVLYLRHAHA